MFRIEQRIGLGINVAHAEGSVELVQRRQAERPIRRNAKPRGGSVAAERGPQRQDESDAWIQRRAPAVGKTVVPRGGAGVTHAERGVRTARGARHGELIVGWSFKPAGGIDGREHAAQFLPLAVDVRRPGERRRWTCREGHGRETLARRIALQHRAIAPFLVEAPHGEGQSHGRGGPQVLVPRALQQPLTDLEAAINGAALGGREREVAVGREGGEAGADDAVLTHRGMDEPLALSRAGRSA